MPKKKAKKMKTEASGMTEKSGVAKMSGVTGGTVERSGSAVMDGRVRMGKRTWRWIESN